MKASAALLVGLGLVACADDGSDADPRFYVERVEPEDGATSVTALVFVYLHLSGGPDPERCTAETLRVDAVRADGTVAFEVPSTVTFSGERFTKVLPDAPYLRGWTYRVTARGGEDGCADLDGVPIEPFVSTFEVP